MLDIKMNYEIKKEDAQTILNYVSSLPTGHYPLGEAIKIIEILMNLKEIKETKNGSK